MQCHAIQYDAIRCAVSTWLRSLLKTYDLVLGHEVGLVEEDAIGKGDLLDRLVAHALVPLLVEVEEDVLGIDHGDDPIDRTTALQIGIGVERLHYRSGVCEPAAVVRVW